MDQAGEGVADFSTIDSHLLDGGAQVGVVRVEKGVDKAGSTGTSDRDSASVRAPSRADRSVGPTGRPRVAAVRAPRSSILLNITLRFQLASFRLDGRGPGGAGRTRW